MWLATRRRTSNADNVIPMFCSVASCTCAAGRCSVFAAVMCPKPRAWWGSSAPPVGRRAAGDRRPPACARAAVVARKVASRPQRPQLCPRLPAPAAHDSNVIYFGMDRSSTSSPRRAEDLARSPPTPAQPRRHRGSHFHSPIGFISSPRFPSEKRAASAGWSACGRNQLACSHRRTGCGRPQCRAILPPRWRTRRSSWPRSWTPRSRRGRRSGRG